MGLQTIACCAQYTVTCAFSVDLSPCVCVHTRVRVHVLARVSVRVCCPLTVGHSVFVGLLTRSTSLSSVEGVGRAWSRKKNR